MQEICWEEITEEILFIFCLYVRPGARTLAFRLKANTLPTKPRRLQYINKKGYFIKTRNDINLIILIAEDMTNVRIKTKKICVLAINTLPNFVAQTKRKKELKSVKKIINK